MRRTLLLLSASLFALAATSASAQNATPHNLILFVPDGLRALKVTPQSAPAMAAIRDKGVNFRNSHSMFPTFTMANASALSTGHYLGDTGTFSNTIFTAFSSAPAGDTVVPFIENDAVLGDIDAHFNGDYLDEETILKMARAKGFSTAAIGKVGPTLIFDHTDRADAAGPVHSIVVDDSTGAKTGVPLSDEMKDAMSKASLPLTAPGRGDNGKTGDAKTPGTTAANVTQQVYFADVASKVVLPMFKSRNKPFVLVYWSRDPDGSQHNQGDSLNTVTPGINGPTSMAGIKNADDNLAQLRKALDDLGLAATTDIIVAADHGFSTISKQSKTSPSAKVGYDDTPKDFLPMGFLALDLAKALDLPLFDPNDKNVAVGEAKHPKAGNGVLGKDPAKPDIVIATNGGSDLIYLPNKDKKLAERTIKALLEQDYVSGLFVDDKLGKFAGTLPMSAINMEGGAVTPTPSIVVNFRTWVEGCDVPTNCQVQVADTVLRQGQGMHGSFGRSDTMNFMAAIGPDFKAGYVDTLPVSNADVGATAAKILGLTQNAHGKLIGRVMTEAMPNGATPNATLEVLKSEAAANGLRTVLNFQRVGAQRYFDAAGFPGRTVGIEDGSGKQKTAGK
jgi:predicted AlkP superfamily pyrophosphatase or phosphodiesterase